MLRLLLERRDSELVDFLNFLICSKYIPLAMMRASHRLQLPVLSVFGPRDLDSWYVMSCRFWLSTSDSLWLSSCDSSCSIRPYCLSFSSRRYRCLFASFSICRFWSSISCVTFSFMWSSSFLLTRSIFRLLSSW